LILALISLFLVPTSAFADTGTTTTDGGISPTLGGDPPTYYDWAVRSVTKNANTSGAWRYMDIVKGPMTLETTISTEVQRTTSGSLMVSYDELTAGLGFSVTTKDSLSKKIIMPVPSGHTWQLKYRVVYYNYTVKQQFYSFSLGVTTYFPGDANIKYLYPKKGAFLEWSYNVIN
jgi:hypothetical protein